MKRVRFTEKEIEIMSAALTMVNDDFSGFPFDSIKNDNEAVKYSYSATKKLNILMNRTKK